MTSRRASEGAGSVLSFTFLDVLMCTMGSLLLLLVVFGVIAKKVRMRREGETASISLAALKAATVLPAGEAAADPTADDPAVIAAQLTQLREEQARIEQLRAEAADRRRQEQDRIAHLEEHERRLEHELAQLHVTLQALESAEQKQTVDQGQADAEVERLKQLVKETEDRLAELRKTGSTQRSYAIVPYKGANGTYRRPVFVECTKDAVTIQPEGIRLTVQDFDGPLRSGNPLAAAIRAAHEELNGRAAAAGRADMPDPYPLLIVRPDGADAYAVALSAIRSWDSDYGYEFVEADWKLKFPESDPRLAQVMAHAVDEARQRQALLAKVAPRRYASRLSSGGGGGGGDMIAGGAGAGGAGGGFDVLTGSGGGLGAHGTEGQIASGGDGRNPLRGATGAGGGNFSDEFAATEGPAGGVNGADDGMSSSGGGQAPGGGATGHAGLEGGSTGGLTGGPGSPSNASGGAVPPATATAAAASGSQPGGAAQRGGANGNARPESGQSSARGAASSTAASAASSGAGSGASGSAASGAGATGAGAALGSSAAMASGSSAGGLQYTQQVDARSAADARGANWANDDAKRHTSAITRPIKVVVAAGQLTVLGDASDAPPNVVSFQQPIDGVLDQLATAIQERVRDWGLAGDDMYWRPTLVVTVAPGAHRQAQRLAHLMENSGIDVKLPEAIASAPAGEDHATR